MLILCVLIGDYAEVLEVIPIHTEDGDFTGTAYVIVDETERVLSAVFDGVKVVLSHRRLYTEKELDAELEEYHREGGCYEKKPKKKAVGKAVTKKRSK